MIPLCLMITGKAFLIVPYAVVKRTVYVKLIIPHKSAPVSGAVEHRSYIYILNDRNRITVEVYRQTMISGVGKTAGTPVVSKEIYTVAYYQRESPLPTECRVTALAYKW